MRPLNHKCASLPAEESGAAGEEAMIRQPHNKPGVLVVDDEHFVRSMVQLGLERNGFHVWLASGGRDAIDLYRKHRENIAVVLLDVRMPGLDGPETLEALRELNSEVRACFMSADTGAYGPEGLQERGAACVITKPFQLEDLASVLRLVVQGLPPGPLPAGWRRPA